MATRVPMTGGPFAVYPNKVQKWSFPVFGPCFEVVSSRLWAPDSHLQWSLIGGNEDSTSGTYSSSYIVVYTAWVSEKWRLDGRPLTSTRDSTRDHANLSY